MKTLVNLVNVFCCALLVGGNDESLVKTKLKLGNILGKVEEYNGAKYSSFRGIPYAKAPIGKLRFQAPEPVTESWDNDLVRGYSSLKSRTFGPLCLLM